METLIKFGTPADAGIYRRRANANLGKDPRNEPDYWRSGFGTDLWRSSRSWFRENAYQQIAVWVLEDNQIGRGFYEKVGFVRDGHTELHQAGECRLIELRYRCAV